MAGYEISKKTFKHVKMALIKFKDVAIPYNINLLKEQKQLLQQVQHDPVKIQNQELIITRTEIQLKNLLYELDTLREEVEDSDLDRFDTETCSLRDIILHMFYEYKELRQSLKTDLRPQEFGGDSQESDTDLYEEKQLIITDDLEEIKLKEREVCLQHVERINSDIEDLHSMFGDLNQMVYEQGDIVNEVDTNVENTAENVDLGVQHLVTASRLKTSIYPVAGAVMGGVLGGPLGFLAGIKVGGLAALSFGCIGYMGGRILKKHNLHDNIAQNPIGNQNSVQEIDSNTKINEKYD